MPAQAVEPGAPRDPWQAVPQGFAGEVRCVPSHAAIPSVIIQQEAGVGWHCSMGLKVASAV